MKLPALREKIAPLLADKKKLGIAAGIVLSVVVLGIVGAKFARRKTGPTPPAPASASAPKPASKPSTPVAAPAPAPTAAKGTSTTVAKSTATPVAKGVAPETTTPPKRAAPLVDRDLEQEARQKRLEEALDACANEIGIFCNRVKDNAWASVKCVRQHDSAILPSCRAKLDALRSNR